MDPIDSILCILAAGALCVIILCGLFWTPSDFDHYEVDEDGDLQWHTK